MIFFLMATRAAIITWITLSLIPAEIMFNAIEAEIERRGQL
jgi:hypothetical protein